MNTVNETGPPKGSHLFIPFETTRSGIQRTDLATGVTKTIWYSPATAPSPLAHVAFDASYWTPWGTYITAEESWCTAPAGCTSPYGRFFELTNPLSAASVKDDAGEDGVLVHRNVIPRVSHEGVQFDKRGNMYFIDELNGGSVYKYASAASCGQIKSGRAGHFAAGQTSVLRVGMGSTPNATGAYTCVPITDANGQADLQLQTVNGVERLYMATTTTNEVYVLDLSAQQISVFTNRATTDLATGLPSAIRHCPARTASPWTTTTTSTSWRTATAGTTTTSGSPAA